jgi:hypothetical protein
VVQSNSSETARLPWHARLLLAAVGGGLVALLVTAALLEPSPRGYGTHQQLRLPPCSFQMLFGMRCPSCGMTTSWSHMMHGHVVQSLEANSGGALLALAAIVFGPWSLVSGLRGRWLLRPLDERIALVLVVTILVVTLLDWGIRLAT